jgi:hypothetical protein
MMPADSKTTLQKRLDDQARIPDRRQPEADTDRAEPRAAEPA